MTRRRAEQGFSSLLVRYWLPVVAYVVVIASISAQPNLRGPVEFDNSDKIYHVIEYGILGLLLARAVGATSPRGSGLGLSLVAISLGILIGTGDEFLQSFVPGRVSSGLDLLADTIGVALAQVLVHVLRRD